MVRSLKLIDVDPLVEGFRVLRFYDTSNYYFYKRRIVRI